MDRCGLSPVLPPLQVYAVFVRTMQPGSRTARSHPPRCPAHTVVNRGRLLVRTARCCGRAGVRDGPTSAVRSGRTPARRRVTGVPHVRSRGEAATSRGSRASSGGRVWLLRLPLGIHRAPRRRLLRRGSGRGRGQRLLPVMMRLVTAGPGGPSGWETSAAVPGPRRGGRRAGGVLPAVSGPLRVLCPSGGRPAPASARISTTSAGSGRRDEPAGGGWISQNAGSRLHLHCAALCRDLVARACADNDRPTPHAHEPDRARASGLRTAVWRSALTGFT